MTARSERPIRREISWVRPPILPRTDSRSERVLVDAGSMAYSAVTQPRPLPLRHRGTPSEAEAAHSTRVRPNSTSTEPAAWSSQCRVMVTCRRASSARPSLRGGAGRGASMSPTLVSASPGCYFTSARRIRHSPIASGISSQMTPLTTRCAHWAPVSGMS